MKKRLFGVKFVFFVISIFLSLLFFILINMGPAISYDSGIILNSQKDYEKVAAFCYNNYLQSDKKIDSNGFVYLINFDKKYVKCIINEYENKDIELTDEEIKSFQVVYDTFYLDKLNLDSIWVEDNFVVFSTVSGTASFIYSINNQKPNFLNSSYQEKRNIWVEKITEQWYYACLQY